MCKTYGYLWNLQKLLSICNKLLGAESKTAEINIRFISLKLDPTNVRSTK